MEPTVQKPTGNRWLLALFAGALLLHVWLVFFNLKMPYLSGHEFRQSQTALITFYIDRDNDFSPFYEQPIFGKPWVSFILEFPLYQWSVVWLSRATEWPHFLSARVISIACFYLALPGMFLALGRWGFDAGRRLLVLAFVLVCPAYIFYTRAFLIDPMALMFSAWFVAGFVRTMDQRSLNWLAVTIVAGVAAALVKSVVFSVWAVPAAAYGAWMLWQDVRARSGWRRPVLTTAWGLATVAPALLLLRWWVAATDALKETNPSTTIFTSKALSQGNWGLGRFNELVSKELWSTLVERWSEAILKPWPPLLVVVGLGMIFLPRLRWKIAGLTGVFFLSQLAFPWAFALQDYYFYSSAAFVIGACGVVAVGIWDSRAPRWLAGVLVLVLLAAPMKTYWGNYRAQQAVVSLGKHAFTDNIKDITPADAVIVVAGYDWASMIPYYSERRALMIRNGMEYDFNYLNRAYKTLEGETVHTLIVGQGVRTNRDFVDFTARALDLDPVPVFSNSFGDVYVSRFHMAKTLAFLAGAKNRFAPDTVFPERTNSGRQPIRVSREESKKSFPMIQPGPTEVDFEYGFATANYNGDLVLAAHTDSFFWLNPPADTKSIEMQFGLIDEAWNKNDSKTNGIEFVIFVEDPNTRKAHSIYRRLLDPARVEADRGLQKATVDYTPKPGERICIAALSNGSKAFDWGYWRSLTLR